MSANAIETLRLGGTWIPRNRRIDIEYDDALAAVEALLEAAKAMSDRYERRDGFPFKPECDALAAAVRRVETGQ